MNDTSFWAQYGGWVIFGGIIAVLSTISWINSIYSEKQSLNKRYWEIYAENEQLKKLINEWESYYSSLQNKEIDLKKKWEYYSRKLSNEESQLKKKQALFRRLFQERTRNYPVVGQIWSDLVNIAELERSRALRYKKRPALRAAEEIKSIKQEKRALIKELTLWKYKAQNYEAVYPWLSEELESDIEDAVEAEIYYTVYTEDEREDPVTQFVSPEDYRKLSISGRNQLALDRYWQRGKRTKWMIGKMYERYVGYLYESQGWDVTYFGIQKRFEDLGRDLIARKGNEVHVVQCKHWSKFKTIYENHIFQLFGTAYSLQKENKSKTIIPVFYCSTSLSDTAKEFAKRLGIVVNANHSLKLHSVIKCNISPNGEKIYHLPFDQQYDNTKIEINRGEFYAQTVKEAEEAGYRRAFRWTGNRTT